MGTLFGTILVALILIASLEVARVLIHARKAVRLGKRATPFSRPLAKAPLQILVIGDSTAVGVGASATEHSFIGHLGADFPHAAIWNIAENAMSAKRLKEALRAVGHMRFDMALIHIGGMDILNFTTKRRLSAHLREAVHILKQICTGPIVFVSANNAGALPAFRYSLLGPVYTRRARRMRDFFEHFSTIHGTTHISLFDEKRDDPLLKDPCRFFAHDGLHPSDDGYRLMYRQKLRDRLQALLEDRP